MKQNGWYHLKIILISYFTLESDRWDSEYTMLSAARKHFQCFSKKKRTVRERRIEKRQFLNFWKDFGEKKSDWGILRHIQGHIHRCLVLFNSRPRWLSDFCKNSSIFFIFGKCNMRFYISIKSTWWEGPLAIIWSIFRTFSSLLLTICLKRRKDKEENKNSFFVFGCKRQTNKIFVDVWWQTSARGL